ncbi:MAG: DUF3604 domain-containing protein [Halioglobus sp.]|nr:DUF3604 domain-containing protein [Halioglobus sp.]
MFSLLVCGFVVLWSSLSWSAQGAVSEDIAQSEQREPCANVYPLKYPFFGDLHVHTRFSLDASTQGTRTTPAQAYRFARGERIGIQPWTEDGKALRSMQLTRPLDFAMVSDHAELIGEVQMCNTETEEGHNSWECILYRNWPRGAYYLFNTMASVVGSHLGLCGERDQLCLRASLVPWRDTQAAAEHYYDRSAACTFTTFIGYEWTALDAYTGGNLHRNVVFRNAQVPTLPASFIEHPSASALWASLDATCIQSDSDCDALVIPHNSNMSAGLMFNGLTDDGDPMDPEYAATRARFEPLVEIMQHKGASECFFEVGVTEDELCAFEQYDKNNIAGLPVAPGPDTGFTRWALADGLLLQQQVGINPYQFGHIASTDTHLGAPGAVQEDDYLGHGGDGTPAAKEAPRGLPDKLLYNPGGLAVLWAQENSRDALFEAMRRREAYATSGPRIVSRFFAGWSLPPNLCEAPDRIEQAYRRGVPMGAVLHAAPEPGLRPAFLVAASQDPGTAAGPGTPLQRIQVIKGWLDAEGNKREEVLDVAGDAANAATVDTKTCETHGMGFDNLCAVWVDQNFDPTQPAFYYSRVIENPTCRWSQRLCIAAGVDCSRPVSVTEGYEGCCATDHRPMVQERAWSSPIWYTPSMNADVLLNQ